MLWNWCTEQYIHNNSSHSLLAVLSLPSSVWVGRLPETWSPNPKNLNSNSGSNPWYPKLLWVIRVSAPQLPFSPWSKFVSWWSDPTAWNLGDPSAFFRASGLASSSVDDIVRGTWRSSLVDSGIKMTRKLGMRLSGGHAFVASQRLPPEESWWSESNTLS